MCFWPLRLRGCRSCGRAQRVAPVYGSISFDDGDSYTVHLKDLDMPNIIFDRPDPSVFTRLDCLGLEVTGHRIDPAHSVSASRIAGDHRRCRRYGCPGEACGTVPWRLAHEPYGCAVHCALCTDRCGRPSSDGGALRPGLGLSWSTANTTVLTVGQFLLIIGHEQPKEVCHWRG